MEGGNIIRNVFGKSYKEAEHIMKDASKGALDFKSPQENTFYGKKGGKKLDEYQAKKDNTLLVTKVEGPLDDNGGKISKPKEGEKHWFKATFNRSAAKNEYKKLLWQIKIGGIPIPFFFDYSSIEGNTQTIQVKLPCYDMRAYAYFKSPIDKVSVEVSIKKLTFPMLILQGTRRKGKKIIVKDGKKVSSNDTAVDMLYGDYPENQTGFNKLKSELYTENYDVEKQDSWYNTTSRTDNATNNSDYTIKKVEDFCKKSSDDLFKIFKSEIEWYSKGKIETVAKKMVDRMQANSGGEFSDKDLTDAVIQHENSQAFISSIKSVIKAYLTKNNGDIQNLEITDSSNGVLYKDLVDRGVDNPKFSDKFSGLGITINDVWAYQIYITKYKKNGRSFEMGLEYVYYDHFGLDYPDIQKYDKDIFYSWFILQHFRGYKPFITKIDIVGEFKGTF
ncbi:DUF3289 family protein [Chryseobacterium sp. MIQD13]|uniref:DUF3289 family protein n=1 Tax=Chryseobacterium sp. MIQD13 TaxID=3422310 RepID=UPI003D2A6759